jgi:uncharacterized membrane protein YdjX (TVP38/TMEM64 family)
MIHSRADVRGRRVEGDARRQRAQAAIFVAAPVLALAGYVLWLWLVRHGLDLAELADLGGDGVPAFIRSWGPWGAVGTVALMVLHSFLPLPAEAIAVANGMIFGPWLGIALTWGGAMLGALVSFALARWLGRPFVRWALPERYWGRIAGVSTRTGTLFLVRLVPVISFNLVNYAAGILGVRSWPFVWTTAIGILPVTITMVLLGHEMPAAPWWIWPLVAAAVLGSWLLWRRDRPDPVDGPKP